MLRDYQERAVSGVFERWQSGSRSVCLVAPTGAGKTRMCAEIVRRATKPRTLWLAHRKELLGQSAETLEGQGIRCGIISPDYPRLLDRSVQVASWQTLLDPAQRPEADLVVIDECHHAPAEEWQAVIDHYRCVRVGATATPERGDGRPMSGIFDSLVIAANYSELIREGHLVPCRVFRPDEELQDGIAQDPLEAYLKSPANGLPGIGFSSLKDCNRFAEAFNKVGLKSAVISDGMGASKRRKTIEAYKGGELAFLWSMHILTEGFDAPHATVCILAGTCGTVGQYLQRCGRVLRPFDGKDCAFLFDLRGVSHGYGPPTVDRSYSLDGKAITQVGSLRVCQSCGYTWDPETDGLCCPSCGHQRVVERLPKHTSILNRELHEAIEGNANRDAAKLDAFKALMRAATARNKGCSLVNTEFKKMFGEPVPPSWWPVQAKFNEFRRLQKLQQLKGHKPGFAASIFKSIFGHWPERKWQWKTDAPWLQR